jgi:hypothetical protein
MAYIFISHPWKETESYSKIINLLKESKLQIQDYSVPEHDSVDSTEVKEIKDALENQIKLSSHVIMVGTMHLKYSKYIQHELDVAQQYNKPILVVKPNDQERIPEILKQYTIVSLRKDAIINWVKNNQ